MLTPTVPPSENGSAKITSIGIPDCSRIKVADVDSYATNRK